MTYHNQWDLFQVSKSSNRINYIHRLKKKRYTVISIPAGKKKNIHNKNFQHSRNREEFPQLDKEHL